MEFGQDMRSLRMTILGLESPPFPFRFHSTVRYHSYATEGYACEDRRCVFLPHAPPQQSSPRTAGPTAAFLHLPAPSLAPRGARRMDQDVPAALRLAPVLGLLLGSPCSGAQGRDGAMA